MSKESRIILTQKTDAHFLDKDGNLNKKGGYFAGKILKVDTTPLKKGDKNFYKVLNVLHDNIFVPLNDKSATAIKPSHIAQYAENASKHMGGNAFENHNNKSLINDTVKKLFHETKTKSGTLDHYSTDAFSGDDGFSHAEGDVTELAKDIYESYAPSWENIFTSDTVTPLNIIEGLKYKSNFEKLDGKFNELYRTNIPAYLSNFIDSDRIDAAIATLVEKP